MKKILLILSISFSLFGKAQQSKTYDPYNCPKGCIVWHDYLNPPEKYLHYVMTKTDSLALHNFNVLCYDNKRKLIIYTFKNVDFRSMGLDTNNIIKK